MLFQAILICVFTDALLAISTDNVAVGVVRPRSISTDAHDEQIRRFWTPEQLAAAKPKDRVLPKSSKKKASVNRNMTLGPPSSIPGSAPLHNDRVSRAISGTGLQVSTTGRVFWRVGLFSESCSASVITSGSNDLVVTAAHCVYDVERKMWFNNNNWVFVPGFKNKTRPHGTWVGRHFTVKQAWILFEDNNYDVAFVALSTLNGQHIQSVVGSQGITFNQPYFLLTYAFGYPTNLDSGLFLKHCIGIAIKSRYTFQNFAGLELLGSCNMGRGASGGPWLQRVVEDTGMGFVVSVNSFIITSRPDIMNGPYFNSEIKSMYDEVRWI